MVAPAASVRETFYQREALSTALQERIARRKHARSCHPTWVPHLSLCDSVSGSALWTGPCDGGSCASILRCAGSYFIYTNGIVLVYAYGGRYNHSHIYIRVSCRVSRLVVVTLWRVGQVRQVIIGRGRAESVMLRARAGA